MAQEPGSHGSKATENPVAQKDQREVDRLKSEITSLKGQLRQTAPKKDALPVQCEILDGEQAALYQRVGGRLVSVTKQFPDRPYTPGKKYGFADTKAALDALVASAKEAGTL